jgi:hypothetical protein
MTTTVNILAVLIILVSGPNELKAEQPRKPEKQIVVTGPNGLELELIYIEPGSFIMGRSTRGVALLSCINFEFGIYLDEGPPRKVTITKGFYIGKYTVTVGQYCKFLNCPDVNQPGRFLSFNYWSRIIKRDGRFVPRPETEDCTANTVHWEGAKAFCEWLSKSTGRRFRLPTEAEWEFMARGPEGRNFPWGNKEPKWSSKATDSNEARFSKPWMGLSVYSIADKFPSGPKEPPDLWPGLGDPPGDRVLRCWVAQLTERSPGLDADQGGIYGFRVLMEVDEDQSERRKVYSIDLPVEFTVWQRSTTPFPKSDGKLLLTLDDITGGQVLVTLSWYDGKPVVATRSLRQNDIVAFTVGNHAYKLKLKKLTNRLVDEDSAVFQLWPATAEVERLLQEEKKIKRLILSLAQIPNAKFVRDTEEHTVEEAIAHMEMKWKWNKSAIKTAEDFITMIGSKSSVTGEPYMIRLADGTVMKSEEWFRKELDLMK